MVTELKDFVPGLHLAFCEPGRSEPTVLGKFVVPKTFQGIFHFKDFDKETREWLDGDDWIAFFSISISDLGTPVLDSLDIHKNVTRWKIKLIEQYRYTLLELALQIVVKTLTPSYRDENVRPFNEKYDEKLLKDGSISLTAENWDEYIIKEPRTEPVSVVRWWNASTEPLTAIELKELKTTINTKLRKIITPEYLQHIANIYTQAVMDGKKPIQVIMDSERVEHRTASDYASKARKLELLPKTKPGVVTIDKPTKKKGKR
ncbi:hypothetical protein MCEGKSH29_00804 [Candidatus Nanopelagicaceae bacterium]